MNSKPDILNSSAETAEPQAADAPTMPSNVDLLPYLMNRLTSRINQLWMKELRPHGLTIPRWQVLSVLTVMDGSRIGALAEMAGAEQAVFSRVVDQMQRDNLVKRKPAKADSRAIEVWITPKGQQLFDQLLPAASSHVQALVQPFEHQEADSLAQGLSKMLDHIDDIE